MAPLTFKKRILPDAGKYLYELVEVNQVTNTFYNPQEKGSQPKRNEWLFQSVDKPEMRVKKWTSTSLSSYRGRKSESLKLYEALLGIELTDEEKEKITSTDELIGKKCFLEIKHEKGQDGTVYAKVVDYSSETNLPF